MPFHRRRTYRRRRRRHAAASRIGRAWRARKRRRTGLLTRTALANRRTIRRIAKAVETKVVDSNQATQALQFNGQFNDAIIVDKDGQEVGAAIPFAGDLLYMQQGSNSDRRIGAWVQLKSLTMHYCVTLPSNYPSDVCWYQIFVVLDRSPTLGASLIGAEGLLQGPNGLVGPPNNALALWFQNLGETGKDGRYKILARRKLTLGSNTCTGFQVPAIAPAAPPATFGSARPAYLDCSVSNLARSGPSSVIGSINLKLNHKINYGPDVSVQPTNQTLRIFAFQCAPTGSNQPRAVLQYYTRVRYKDA